MTQEKNAEALTFDKPRCNKIPDITKVLDRSELNVTHLLVENTLCNLSTIALFFSKCPNLVFEIVA